MTPREIEYRAFVAGYEAGEYGLTGPFEPDKSPRSSWSKRLKVCWKKYKRSTMADKIPSSKGPSATKAYTMLHEGVANGKPITERQKRFFAARANSGAMSGPNVKRGKRPKAARRLPR